MRRYTFLFFTILILVFAFIDKGQISGDGSVRWNALVQLVENHQLTAEKFSIVQPILATPLYLAADLWVKSQNENTHDSKRIGFIRRVVQRFNKCVALFIAILFYRSLRNVFEFDQRKALFGTLFLLFGSILIPNAADFYSECLGSLLLLTTLISLTQLCVDPHDVRKFSNAVVLIASMSLLIALTPITCIPLGSILLFLAFLRYRKVTIVPSNKAVLLPMIAWILGVSLVLGENFIRRGSMVDFGYATEELRSSFSLGLLGLLVSPTRGILFFIPTFFFGILLFLRRKDIELTSRALLFISLSLIYSAFLVLAYSKYYYWHGGWYWGPRYMLALSIFGALYFAVYRFKLWTKMNRWQKAIWIFVGVLSVCLYKIGVTINQKYLMKCLQAYPLDERCYWDFAYFPYVSLFDPIDLRNMIIHRSTVVEIVAAVLFLLLFVQMKRRAGKKHEKLACGLSA